MSEMHVARDVIDDLRGQLAAAEDRAAGWRAGLEAVLTVLGLSSALSAGEAVVEAREHDAAMRARLADAERDRDALLAAVGFKAGPLGDGHRRDVILKDAGGLRDAMVEARRAAERVQGDADLWTMRMLDEWPGDTLLLRLWRQRREAVKEARSLRGRVEEVEAERDAAKDYPAPENLLEPEWGQDTFRAVLGETYRPNVWGKHEALQHIRLRHAMRIAQQRAPEVADTIAALIWDANIVGNRAHHAFELAEKRRKEAEFRWPETLTPVLLQILGMVPWRTGRIAHAYRAAGHEIPKKMEDEQAFVMHRLITFALRHGPDWVKHAQDEMRSLGVAEPGQTQVAAEA